MKQTLEWALRSSVVAVLVLVAPVATGQSVPIVTTFDEVLPGATLVEGLEEGDALGGEVIQVGDVDGDGLGDLAFMARYRNDRPYDCRILLGFRWLEKKLDLSAWASWGVELHSQERFPLPGAALGDLDGDGFDDLAFSAEGPDAGKAVILFGGRLGTPALPAVIDADSFTGCRTARIQPDMTLDPPSTAPVILGSGDFDGDGNLDLAVSTRRQPDPDLPAQGFVYLIPGSRPFPSQIELSEIGSVTGSRIRARGETDDPMKSVPYFGREFAAADFDGDGKDDLVLSTPHWTFEQDGTTREAPAVLVLFGRESWPADLDAVDPAVPGVCRLVPASDDVRLAEPILEVPGDLTGDDVPDLLVSTSMGEEPGCFLISGRSLVPGRLVLEDVGATFFTSEDGLERIAGLGDWYGDGRRELAFGLPGKGNGSVIVLPVSDPLPARTSIDARLPGSLEVLGTDPNGYFGQVVEALDLDGDGRKELVASAPGLSFPLDPSLQGKGRLIVLHGESDYLGPLGGTEFSPKRSSLRGDGLLRIQGKGFDGRTEVLLGEVSLQVVERPDSRLIAARIPSSDKVGSFPVRIRRGADVFEFSAPFTYFEGVFPAELDIDDIGEGGWTIRNRWPAGPQACGFNIRSHEIRGGYDFTGDGLSEVLFPFFDSSPNMAAGCPGTLFLLHGSTDLPLELGTDTIEDRATLIDSEIPSDFRGYRGNQPMLLVGDMTGDGRSELAIGAAKSACVYLIFGHDLATGPTTVQELLRQGQVCKIDGFPRTPIPEGEDEAHFWIIEAGDVNGDGLRDLGFIIEDASLDTGGAQVKVGCLAILLGRRDFPPVISFSSLPKVYGKLPLVEATEGSTIRDNADGVGDVNGDGFDDIAIQAVSYGDEDEGFWGAFNAWFILFGRSSWPVSTTIDEELDKGGARELVRNYWQEFKTDYHASIAGIGDQDRDGKDDLGVVVSHSTKGGSIDDFRLLYGKPRAELDAPRDPRKPEDFDAIFPITPALNESLGLYRGGRRDLNGDGIPEILLYDVHVEKPPPSRAIFIFGGNLKERAAPLGELSGTFQLLCNGECGEDRLYCIFPIGTSFGGDVNGDGREDIVIATLGRVLVYFNPLGPLDETRPFRRGDSNSDGALDLSDAVSILRHLFLGGEEPSCLDAADVDDDERLDLSDPIRLLRFLFLSGEPPAPPRECGPDPDGTTFDCRESACP
jgi:hypothetical protein